MLVTRLLALNFVGNRTASVAFTHALWSLLNCESEGKGYWKELRQEVESIMAGDESEDAMQSKAKYRSEGFRWMRFTKQHTAQMVLVESFLKESLRYNTDTNLECKRMVVDPAGYTFKNGIHLRQGTVCAAPIWQIHHDDDIYPNPEEFDAHRFCDMRENGNVKGTNIQSTSEYFLAFGVGRHAW